MEFGYFVMFYIFKVKYFYQMIVVVYIYVIVWYFFYYFVCLQIFYFDFNVECIIEIKEKVLDIMCVY